MVLVGPAVVGDGGGVRVSGEDRDVAVDTPRSAELQEADGVAVDIVLEPGLVGDGPSGGYGREVSPAVLDGELRGVECVRAEVGLEAVAVVVAVGQTSEVGDLRGLRRSAAADALGAGAVVLGDVAEVLGVALQGVGAGESGVHAAAVVEGVGHTCHRSDVMLAEAPVEVGEVLPLVIEALRGPRGDAVALRVVLCVHIVRLAEVAGVALRDAVAEARGEHQALEGSDVGEQGAADVPSFAPSVGARDIVERVHTVAFKDVGGRVELAFGVRIELIIVVGPVHGVAVFVGVAHARGHFAGAVEVDGRERVDDEGSEEGSAVLVRASDVGFLIVLDGGVGAYLEPRLDLVVGVDLRGEALVHILVSLRHTVLVHVVEREIVGSAVVSALRSDGVAAGDALSVEDVGPVGVGDTVPESAADELLTGAELAGLVLPVDELLGVEDFGAVGEGRNGVLVVVEHPSVLALGAGLGGDEDDSVACLGAVDGGGGCVLEDLHGLDHFRVEVLDVVNLEAVYDEEGSEAGAGVGGDTADADMGAFTGGAGVGVDLDAGRLSLEGRSGVGDRAVGEVLRADRCDRAGEVGLALHAVSDHDGLFYEFIVLFEGEVDDGRHSRGDCL